MYELRSGAFLTPHGRQVTMEYRDGTNDYNTLNACMSQDEYGLAGRSFTGFALDIGGYLGGVGIGLALDNPELVVTIVEPVPPNAELIRRNMELNGLGWPRVQVIEGAAGGPEPVSVWYGYRGSEALEHHAFVGNSTLAYDYGGEAEHEEVIYPDPWSLERLIGPARASLVKIDCEGAEWNILADQAVERCDLILGEWHPVRGHTQGNMAALLGGTHTVTFSGPVDGPGGFVAVLR